MDVELVRGAKRREFRVWQSGSNAKMEDGTRVSGSYKKALEDAGSIHY